MSDVVEQFSDTKATPRAMPKAVRDCDLRSGECQSHHNLNGTIPLLSYLSEKNLQPNGTLVKLNG